MFSNDIDPDRLDQLWGVMTGEKGDLVTRCEEYARWTIPAMFPMQNTEMTEQHRANIAISPRLVNNLANRIVDVMFPHERPFFAITLTPEARAKIRRSVEEDAAADYTLKVRQETRLVEEAAMRTMNLTAYRPQAVEAVRLLIGTGNSLVRRMDDDKRVIYSVRDYCIRRKVDGTPWHLVLCDEKLFMNLPEKVKEAVRASRPEIRDVDPCKLYTEYKWHNGRWHERQAVDDVMLAHKRSYKKVDAPFLALAWSLPRGRNYANGLVEEHASSFHQLEVLTDAVLDMAGIAAEVKFLVDPASVLDVMELNNSDRGSYHQGREGDISVPQVKNALAIRETYEMIQALERELSQAFLLNSNTVRDAERVTAEEIRFIANELESAFGGLYSRLALDWQGHEAEYAVSQINFDKDIGNSKLSMFEVVVTTGLESLSREGMLDNLRRAIADLQMLDAVPEEYRNTINPQKFASFIFNNHSVDHQEFLYSKEELAQLQADAQKAQQDAINMQAEGKVREQAGVQAMKES